MIKYFFSIITLHFGLFMFAQNPMQFELKEARVSFQNRENTENSAINHHNTINLAYKQILKGDPIEGMMVLKPALYGANKTLAIDWFMGALAYAMLNEKQGVELMLNEALALDLAIDSLMRTEFAVKLFGGLLGEKTWQEFINEKRNLTNLRQDLALIAKLSELEALDMRVHTLEQIYKDSILVNHKSDKQIKEQFQYKIDAAKLNRDKAYAGVLNTDAWPFTRMRNLGKTDTFIAYEDVPSWYDNNEARLMTLLHNEVLLPWEFAFIHDWHAKRHQLPQKYALFYGGRLDEYIVMNCEAIGMPWGDVRKTRMFYNLPSTF